MPSTFAVLQHSLFQSLSPLTAALATAVAAESTFHASASVAAAITDYFCIKTFPLTIGLSRFAFIGKVFLLHYKVEYRQRRSVHLKDLYAQRLLAAVITRGMLKE